MAETRTKRQREKYSKLICLGCRARRIRCKLPDSDIQPSSEPQPQDRACQRCQQNGLDCIVDYTTLGRPAQKRARTDQASNQQFNNDADDDTRSNDDHEDNTTQDAEQFLLSRPETEDDDAAGARLRQLPPSKSELCRAMISPFHLISALLSRDKQFAASVGSQPLVKATVLEVVDDPFSCLLDQHLVWHRLYYPDIPSLAELRKEATTLEKGSSERTVCLFLLTLLCDLALDVPSTELASYRQLQPALRALTYHWGQQLLFTLTPMRYTVLSFVLIADYRPLVLTSSQLASAQALKAVPHYAVAKYVSSALGFSSAGKRLTEALNNFDASLEDLTTLMHECLHWIQLNLAEDLLHGPINDWIRSLDPTVLESLEALHSAALIDRMPEEILLPYSSLSYTMQALANLKDVTSNWRRLDHLGDIIVGHNAFCEREKDVLDRMIDQQCQTVDEAQAISQLADSERFDNHKNVVGGALFFAVMRGQLAHTDQKSIETEHAVQVSDNIIEQLLTDDNDDSDQTDNRKFLETYGDDRLEMHERGLTNFITAADTLKLNGIPFVGKTRVLASNVLFTCKNIVDEQAARLKGWGGLHDRVDLQMILFLECARSLEGMSFSAGSRESMGKACILTAAGKLIRSLHRILQGFKKAERRKASERTKSHPRPSPLDDMSRLTESASIESDDILSDDLFTYWQNWPQFDAFDFSDLFGSAFNFDPTANF